MAKEKQFILYKIYYEQNGSDNLVYLGRTRQPLKQRLYGHFFKPQMMRTLSLNITSKVEYALCKTEADMNLYEIYYINLYKPVLNIDDKCGDEMTITLPDLEWIEWNNDILDKWKERYIKERDFDDEKRRVWNISCEIGRRAVRILRNSGKISDDEYDQYLKDTEKIYNSLRKRDPQIDEDFVKRIEKLTAYYVDMNEESEDKDK